MFFCFLPRPGKRRKNGFGKHPFSSVPGGPNRRDKVFSRKPFAQILTLYGLTCRKYFCVFIQHTCTKNKKTLSSLKTCWYFRTKIPQSNCSICIIYADFREMLPFRSEGNFPLISGFYEGKINIMSTSVTVRSDKFGVPEDYLTKILVYIKANLCL